MTLIESSMLLSYSQKLDIIDAFPLLTEEQIEALGKFLATEEKIREEFPEDIQKGVESVLTQIVGEPIKAPSATAVYVGTGKAS